MASSRTLSISPTLAVKEIKDPYIQKNFQNLKDYFQTQNQLLDFKFFEIEFTQAESNRKIQHGLGGIPVDLIRTYIVGTGAITFHRDEFDSTYIVVSASGPVLVRFFAGIYFNSAVGDSPTGNEVWFSQISSGSSTSGDTGGIVDAEILDGYVGSDDAIPGTVIRLTNSGTIEKMVAGFSGQSVTLINSSGTDSVFENDNADGTKSHSILTSTGTYLIFKNQSVLTLIYDEDAERWRVSNVNVKTPTKQIFTSGSGTYTRPDGCVYIKVRMCGGGSGGSGGGNTGASGGAGGDTTFGTSLLTAGGGTPGGAGTGGGGGTVTVNSPAIDLGSQPGQAGDANAVSPTRAGTGGSTPYFGGGGAGATGTQIGGGGTTNSGGGGQGGGAGAGTIVGAGGGSGGYVHALIASPSATYSYSVGAGGTAGAASGGAAPQIAGVGAAGKIEVEEYYS
jgi:hypothetical protein